MSALQDDARMVRKQYHLSIDHVRKVEALREELGLGSDAELIRRAIDTFDSAALDSNERELVMETADQLREHVAALNARIESTLERAQAARKRLGDPAWIEGIRERTRREAADDPALVAGMARLIGT